MRALGPIGLVAAATLLVPVDALAAGPPAAEEEPPSCGGLPATLVADSFGDTLTGTPGRDVIYGSDGDDTISGLAGNDLVCGRRGSDHISGGPGDDKLFGGRDGEKINPSGEIWLEGDLVAPGRGGDLVDLGHHRGVHFVNGQSGSGEFLGDVLSYADSSQAVDVDLAAGTATGQGRDILVRDGRPRTIVVQGSPHDDVVTGSEVPDWIDPGAGGDTVLGRAGADHIFERDTGSGSDAYGGGDGADVVSTMDGRDAVQGGAGSDSLDTSQTGSENGAVVAGGRGADAFGFFAVGQRYAYHGGPGHDRGLLVVDDLESTTLDLLDGRVHHADKVSRATGIRDWTLQGQFGPLAVIGTRRADYVSGYSADSVTARLAGGADILDATELTEPSDIWAGPGDDHLLVSGPGELVVRLGAGDDLAEDLGGLASSTVHEYYGGSGFDTLSAPHGQPVTCDSIESGDCPVP